ncbi:MAG: hypothetical protein IPN76_19005 [Saprospiraceae bacterium]|nr:hypothetical protein [Saprospiraceae bacterium]
MSRFTDVVELPLALKERKHPTAVFWNRLEGRPRTDNFTQSLRAEVRDSLWMIARQWQMGEYEGDDAGSPVFAKLHTEKTKLRKYQPLAHGAQSFDDEKPLETQVECMPIPMQIATQPISLDIRLLMGRHWGKMMNNPVLLAAFVANYAIEMPDRTTPAGAPVFAHKEVWQQWAAVAGRRMDGYKFYRHLKDGGLASDGIPGADDTLGQRFVDWFEALFFQPSTQNGNKAWAPERLEYQFSVSAPRDGAEMVLRAAEYYHGHLDWYSVDHDKQAKQLGDTVSDPSGTLSTQTQTFVPTQVSFNGMPNTRWWAFEDGKTNFGELRPGRNDLARLLMMEFVLVYANDWFLLPIALEAGSMALVKGLAVTNVFGERTWIEAGNRGLDDDFKRWSMFTMNTLGKRLEPADLTLAVLPTVAKMQEGKPFEEFAMVRDEMANMVWGVETRIPSPNGGTMNAKEAAYETRRFFEELAKVKPEDLPVFKANIRYEVMNDVPENWIPFIPVHEEGSSQAIHLQRSSMLRFIKGDVVKPRKVKPRTDLLREGLDKTPVEVYFIREEEVPRSGIYVSQSFQRTRWYNGRVFTWLGARKRTGRGEGASGLAFDRVIDKPA